MTHIATMGKPGVPGRWIRVRSPGAEASVLAIEISVGREFDRGFRWLSREQYCRGGRLRPSEHWTRGLARRSVDGGPWVTDRWTIAGKLRVVETRTLVLSADSAG